MSDLSNLKALSQGCVSGRISEWPRLKPEAAEALAQIEEYRKQLGEAMAAIARIYMVCTGCSLPEFDTIDEIADTIIQHIYARG